MSQSLSSRFRLLALLLCLFAFSGCAQAYYGMMETFGQHKRDILVSRIKDTRDDQVQTKQVFKDALTRFSEVVKVEPSALESTYKKLKSDLENCESQAQTVRDRIASVEDVAQVLFDEWNKELSQYTNAQLRSASESKLRDTRQRYDQLLSAMKRAQDKMEPVLTAFRDQVLFLKHNLNAQAVASLSGTVQSLQSDVQKLINEMESSIAQADTFINSLNK